MKISEPRYYQAKVFFTALADAHAVLRQVAQEKAKIAKLHSYEHNLIQGVKQGSIKISNGTTLKSGNFQSSNYAQLSNFSKKYFKDHLKGFLEIGDVQGLTNLLEKSSQ